MADTSDPEQAVGTSVAEEPTVRGRRKGQAKSREPSRAREEVGDFETRLSRLELYVAGEESRVDGLENRVEGLAEDLEETRGEAQAAHNMALDKIATESEVLRVSQAEEVSALREENRVLKGEVEKIKDDLAMLKRVMNQGSGADPSVSHAAHAARMDVPKPSAFKGSRSAKEIDNFLWTLDQYFRALGVDDDARKIDNAPLYLADSAMVWWRRRLTDVEKGTCTISTWDEFKKELKKQFYPENAATEARARLRRLTQKGTIKEYVKDFTEVLLEIPDYPDLEALFAFKDGLQPWVNLEIERRGAQDLATAIAIAESLVEFKRTDKSKGRDGKSKGSGDKGGNKEGSGKEVQKEGNGKKGWQGKKDTREGKGRGHLKLVNVAP
ncbi:hypothetical protein GH714_040396 [Hevea brasiliensis]|uniref:Retrotransposon gag domain-containing protein n=1 Tax=Hevea brasiliensis TaxID=3981 RepID=A0A6A6MV70_HEVBR|nr:hypothetical protein GH714_027336 [Hevea brasiliensis]KAF2315849.1 hypothetical protein GH714_040396 [Hevea brasiliensis]